MSEHQCPIKEGSLHPRNIWAVGRNYQDHIAEMKSARPEVPLLFLKAGSSATCGAASIKLPAWCKNVHYETELALVFDETLNVSHWALALDLTERDEQSKAKAQGLPWTLAKSFRGACPLTVPQKLKSPSAEDELKTFSFSMSLNGEIRQQGHISEMIFTLTELTAYTKTHFPVVAGDVLLTGTPQGVGPLRRGDEIQVLAQDQALHTWRVV